MTKNFRKAWTLVVLMFALAAVMPQRAGAVNLNDALLNEADQTMVGGYVDSTKSAALTLKYVGTDSSTGAYVTISATQMTFYHPFGTADTTIGSSGVITYSSTLGANTVGSLCDYINTRATRNYSCTLLGAKRDDAPSVLRTKTAADGVENLAAVAGSSVSFVITAGTIRLGINPTGGRRVVLYGCTGNINGTDTLNVYGQLRKWGSGYDDQGTVTNDTKLVWSVPTADDTDKVIPQATQLTPWLEFANGAHVVISGGNTTNMQLAANYVQCFWSEK